MSTIAVTRPNLGTFINPDNQANATIAGMRRAIQDWQAAARKAGLMIVRGPAGPQLVPIK